jgi:FdhE protein
LLATLTNESSLNSITSDAIHGLKKRLESDPNQVEALADAILTGAKLEDPLDAQLAPFVGAALQLHFTRIAQSLDPSDLQNSDVPGVCPCCGSRPTASLVHMEPDRVNSRYLVCSLCQTEWNMERVKCSSCYKEGGVAYMVIDNDPRATTAAAIRAETCDDCKTYLKIFIQEKDPMLDVLADDLASIKLDILVDENGYSRTGPNLLLYPGHD